MQSNNIECKKYKIVDRRIVFLNENTLSKELVIYFEKPSLIRKILFLGFIIMYIGMIVHLYYFPNRAHWMYIVLIVWSFVFFNEYVKMTNGKPNLTLSNNGIILKNEILLKWQNIYDEKFYNGSKDNSARYLKFYYLDEVNNRKYKYDENIDGLEIHSKDIETAFYIYKERFNRNYITQKFP
jgi:hypothetical protein